MLILSRKKDESFILRAKDEKDISIKILKTGKRIKIGIDASDKYTIYRKELIAII